MQFNDLKFPDSVSWGNQEHSDSELSMFDILKMVIRSWKMILCLTLAITMATVVYAKLQPNVYTARSKFLPPPQQGGGLSAAMLQGALASAAGGADLLGGAKLTTLYVEILKIDALRDQVIERLKLHGRYNIKSRQEIYNRLNSAVAVQAGKEGIITVSVTDVDPKHAAELANAFVDELKNITAGLSVTGASNNKSFLKEQIAKTKEELTAAENDLKAFQKKYKTIDAAQQATASAGAMASLMSQLTAQELKLDSLRSIYADTSPEIIAARRGVDALRGKIAALRGSGDGGMLPGFEKIPERGQEYLHLMRRFKSVEAVYENLVKQHEMAKINVENTVSSIQLLQSAAPPELKSGPARLKMVISSLVLSFIASCFLAIGLEYLRNMPDEQKSRCLSLFGKQT